MANEQNLKPFDQLPESRQREIRSMGGKACAEARKRRKTLAEIGDMIGNLKIKSEKNKQILRDAGITDEDLINDTMMMFQLTGKAAKGNERAIETLAKIRKQLTNVNLNENHNVEYKPLIDLTERKKNGS